MSLPLGTPDTHHREGAGCCEGATTNAAAQLCPTHSDPTDCSPPGFSVRGVFQARILEWAAISYSRGSSLPRGLNPSLLHLPALAGGFFITSATQEAQSEDG